MFGTDSPIFKGVDGKATEFPVIHPEHVHQPLVQEIVEEVRLERVLSGRVCSNSCSCECALPDGHLRLAFRGDELLELIRADFVASTGESATRTAIVMDAVLRKFYKCAACSCSC